MSGLDGVIKKSKKGKNEPASKTKSSLVSSMHILE
jgi:hypothetical protein